MKRLVLGLLAMLALTLPGGAVGQVTLDADPGSSIRTRSDLEDLLQLYEQVLASPAYSDEVKEVTRVRAQRIRERLTEGDFKLGDRVVLRVEGEPSLPDTVPVQAGPKITLPLFGDIPLDGVLRSEIEAHLTESLQRFIRDPIVRAQGLMRIAILGAVGQPGFYVVPADMLLSESLMMAGGPAGNADLEDLRIERGTETLLEGEELQEFLRGGRTLDQLNLQAGDQVMLPTRAAGGFLGSLGVIVGLVSSITFIVFQLSR